MKINIILLYFVFSSSAHAQTSSHTNCWVNGQYVSCSTQTQPDHMLNFNKSAENMRQQLQRMQEAADYEKASEAQAQLQARREGAASDQAYIRRRVGELATSGDCMNARQMAAANGLFQLHSEVDIFCKARGR